jgi:hypothetical protein
VTERRKIRLKSTVNKPAGAKSGLSAKAREILERTRQAKKRGAR